MNWLEQWFNTSKELISDPVDFYDNYEEKSYKYLVGYVATSGIIYTLLFSLFNIINNLVGSSNVLLTQNYILLLASGIFTFTTGVIIFSTLYHIIALILGGKKFKKTFAIVTYSTPLIAFFGWIPLVYIMAAIYAIYTQIKGIQKLHDFSLFKSAATVLIPVISIIVLMIVSIILFLLNVSTGTYL